MYGTVVSARTFMMRDDEVCDELLHGMRFRVLGPGRDDGMYYIETDYGYKGDISAHDVQLHDNTSGEELFMVSGMFADVLASPSIKSKILKTLVRGSLVRVVGKPEDGVVPVLLADGIRGYIRAAFVRVFVEPRVQLVFYNNEKDIRNSILDSAMGYIGTQYRWGGKSPLGIDCSGLCFMAYRENGITIYRDAAIKPGYAIREISLENMKPADLAFLPSHVAMYAGGGMFIHSSVRNNGVTVDRLEGYPVVEMVVGSVFF